MKMTYEKPEIVDLASVSEIVHGDGPTALDGDTGIVETIDTTD